MEHIVFLDRSTMGPDVELKRPAFAHKWIDYEHTHRDQIVERLQGATIAVTNKVPLGEQELAQLPELRMIAVAATGVDIIDLDACRRRGIVVSNVRGYAAQSVPEHTFALIFALRRNILAYREDVLAGEWERNGEFCFFTESIRDIGGATLGIIGAGTLGEAVGRTGEALGMRCLYAGRKGGETGEGRTPFEQVLEESDVLTLHLPLTPESRGLIAGPEFGRMARRPILINTARGGVVDESALVEALDSEQVSGAGIDCVAGEPPSSDSPIHRIKHYRNVIVTPHVAWASLSAREALWAQLIDCLEQFVAGTPRNVC